MSSSQHTLHTYRTDMYVNIYSDRQTRQTCAYTQHKKQTSCEASAQQEAAMIIRLAAAAPIRTLRKPGPSASRTPSSSSCITRRPDAQSSLCMSRTGPSLYFRQSTLLKKQNLLLTIYTDSKEHIFRSFFFFEFKNKPVLHAWWLAERLPLGDDSLTCRNPSAASSR